MTIDNVTTERATSPIPAGRYRLIPEMTTVSFSAKKFGVFTISGTMTLSSGTFTIAPQIEDSSLHAVLAADTFRTPMANRDRHVKGATLLDVATYPTMTFDSTELAPTSAGWAVHGLLAVHGNVTPVVLTVTTASWEGGLARLSGAAQIDRREFGVTGMRLAASARVDIRIEARGAPIGAPTGPPPPGGAA